MHHPEGLKASDLSSLLRVSMPTVSQMVNVLEARGLLERRLDPADRRVVRIRLSEQGQSLTEEAEQRMFEAMGGLVAHLGEERCRQLIDLLDDVAGYYRDLPAQPDRPDSMDTPQD